MWTVALVIFIEGILLFSPSLPAQAAGEEAIQFFEEEAQVSITASRRPQPVQEAPVAIDVITQEEIRASAATNIWDLMRFRVGMDVMDGRSADGNRGIVTIRGFPQEYVNNMQVLVDGRSVYTGYEGGVVWPQLPVQIQDIDRIEIVRGPNAALYGSNAGLGVINIITKKPEAKTAVSAYGQGGNLETRMGGAAADFSVGGLASRLSYSYWHEAGFPNAPNPLFPAKDDLTANLFNYRGLLSPSDSTKIELLGGGALNRQGITYADQNGKFHDYFGMAKLQQTLGGNSSIEFMVARHNYTQDIFPNIDGHEKLLYTQDDAEMLHRISWWNDRLKTTWGANYRNSVSQSEQTFSSAPRQGITADSTQKIPYRRIFLHQSIDVIDGLTLVGAASVEHSNLGGTEPAYQSAIILTPVKNHTFRLTYSLSPTIPNSYDSHANVQYAGPPFSVFLHGNPNQVSQILKSYEAGYRGAYLDKKLDVETNLFFMDIKHIVYYYGVIDPFFTELTILNNQDEAAIVRGAEAKLTYRIGHTGSVYTNYTFETISDRLGDDRINKSTPHHKVNFGGQASLGEGFSGSVNVGFKSRYAISSADSFQTVAVKSYWRLDARLAYRPIQHMEIFVAGKNLLDSRHIEFQDALEVPRTYYGGMSLQF
ncbi:MAG: TonB-dependent receptor [Nitrospirae bacterium]|nr:TonB-dependent receptor [Nitrospirota bacterium]